MYKVMIVDDEHIIRQGIVSLIDWNELGCEVVQEAADGEYCLCISERAPGRYPSL